MYQYVTNTSQYVTETHTVPVNLVVCCVCVETDPGTTTQLIVEP